MAPVIVRTVWQSNLESEFRSIQGCLNNKEYQLVSMDTEFPGTVFKTERRFSTLSASEHYSLMKMNVDALNIIQLGLTLSDPTGNLPTHVWEFNFRDFDSDYDLFDPASVALLRSQGIDFAANSRRGIRSRSFASCFLKSGLVRGRAWVTFHGLYDLGFLVKILTRKPLPEKVEEFVAVVRCYLGDMVYDLKPIARDNALPGGLEAVAKSMFLERAAGKSHQAGSDSLLAMQVFMRLVMNRYCTSTMLRHYNYLLYGLTTTSSSSSSSLTTFIHSDSD